MREPELPIHMPLGLPDVFPDCLCTEIDFVGDEEREIRLKVSHLNL